MQNRGSASFELQRALANAENRVQTIAQVHDRLWRANDVHSIDLAEFLDGVCGHFRTAGLEHAVACEAPSVMISTEEAVPLGLLANELMTNAIKYASPHAPGDVNLSVSPIDDHRLRFEVRAHGPGLPAGYDAARSKSLSMKLIGSLGRQLGGTPEWQNADPGTRFVLEFLPKTLAG